MHLAIDVSEFEQQPTGVGSFIGGLLSAWAGAIERGQLQITLLARDLQHEQLPARCRGTVTIRNVGRRGAHPIVWQQTSLPVALRRLRADVFFGPAYSLPHFHATPSVVAMHDLSFERFPESWSWRERWRRRLLARSAARRARSIVTISRFSADELSQIYRVAPERIVVTPLGVRQSITTAPALDNAERRAVRNRLGLEPEADLVLHVGTLFERRHLPELVAAVGRLEQPTQLVVVGADRTRAGLDFAELSRRHALKIPVVHLPWIDDEELVRLYTSSDVLVSLSSYEGFGLPVLEAMAAGLPALVLDRGASAELWGEHAATVDSLEARAVADAITGVLAEPDTGLRARHQALHHHTWDRCGEIVLEALQGAAAR